MNTRMIFPIRLAAAHNEISRRPTRSRDVITGEELPVCWYRCASCERTFPFPDDGASPPRRPAPQNYYTDDGLRILSCDATLYRLAEDDA